MFSILGFFGGLFKAFAAFLGFEQRRADQKAGAVAQAGVETQQAVVTEVAIAQAEADAPRTQAAVVDSLNAGTF